MHIVVIEDQVSLAKGIAYSLRDEGHAVDLLHDGDEANLFLQDCNADIVILDINLPGQDGVSLLRAMRARNDFTPVLLLTARTGTDAKITGLDAGADDYLVKPFEMRELLARIRALARRGQTQKRADRWIGSLRFDPNDRTVHGPDGPLDLPRREVSLFEALLLAQGRTMTKQTLLTKLYGTGADPDEKVIEVYVSRLRKRLKEFGVEIRVRRGLGYDMQDVS